MHVRTAAVEALKNDYENYLDMKANANGDFWDEIKGRSVFKSAPVVQLIKIFEQCGWDLENCEETKAFFEERKHELNCSMANEHGAKVARRQEQVDSNKQLGPAICSTNCWRSSC